MRSINPATGEKIREHANLDAAELDRRLERSDRAFARGRETPIGARTDALRRLAAELRTHAVEDALLNHPGNGKADRGRPRRRAVELPLLAGGALPLARPDLRDNLERQVPFGGVKRSGYGRELSGGHPGARQREDDLRRLRVG